MKRILYEERSGFKNYFQLYFDCGRFGIVYQDMNMGWTALITDRQHDEHCFKYRTHAMDYLEDELKIKYRQELNDNFKITRPRYKK